MTGHHAHVADVAEVIDGDAAHIHADLAGLDAAEWLELPAQGIVDAKHAGNVTRNAAGGAAQLPATFADASTIFDA